MEDGWQLQSGKHLPSVPQQLKDHVIIVDRAPTEVKGKPFIDCNELWSSFKISLAYAVLTLWKPKASQFNPTHPQLKQKVFSHLSSIPYKHNPAQLTISCLLTRLFVEGNKHCELVFTHGPFDSNQCFVSFERKCLLSI